MGCRWAKLASKFGPTAARLAPLTPELSRSPAVRCAAWPPFAQLSRHRGCSRPWPPPQPGDAVRLEAKPVSGAARARPGSARAAASGALVSRPHQLAWGGREIQTLVACSSPKRRTAARYCGARQGEAAQRTRNPTAAQCNQARPAAWTQGRPAFGPGGGGQPPSIIYCLRLQNPPAASRLAQATRGLALPAPGALRRWLGRSLALGAGAA